MKGQFTLDPAVAYTMPAHFCAEAFRQCGLEYRIFRGRRGGPAVMLMLQERAHAPSTCITGAFCLALLPAPLPMRLPAFA